MPSSRSIGAEGADPGSRIGKRNGRTIVLLHWLVRRKKRLCALHICLSAFLFTFWTVAPLQIPKHDLWSTRSARSYAELMPEMLNCLNISGRDFVTDIGERRAQFTFIHRYVKEHAPKLRKWNCYRDFCGPWLENYWINIFGKRPLEDFGVFVPLFVRWLDLWVSNRTKYDYFIRDLSKTLRRDFIYVTVSQNADGVEGTSENLLPDNLFIVSGGGKGHVPVLLFKRPMKVYEPILPSKYDAAFMGNHLTSDVRVVLINGLEKALGDRLFWGDRGDWIKMHRMGKTVLCPRGWGRSSFRTTETLQMGLIPVYVYSDVIWLPYYGALDWDKLGFIIRIDPENGIDETPKLVRKLRALSEDDAKEMRKRIISLIDSHFSVAGTMRQLDRFLRYGFAGTDLRCTQRKYGRYTP